MKDKKLRDKAKLRIKEFLTTDKFDSTAAAILKTRPNLVAFSCYIWNITNTLKVCAILKMERPQLKIVLGGPQVSPVSEDILRDNPFIDIVVRGEGEITFAELIERLSQGREDLKTIKGISFRDKGQITVNPDRAPINNLNAIPFPYDKGILRKKNRAACLETHRGCIFNCSFCYYQKSYKGIRYFGIDRIKKNLAFLMNHKLKRIYVMDPVFNIDLKRAKEICRFIIKHNKYNIPFNTELKAELVDEELAQLLKGANFNQLEVGLQSTNKTVLKSVNRSLNRKNFERGFKLLQKYDVPAELQLIFGLPEDNLESFMESADYAVGLNPYKLSLFDLSVLPGTKIWEDAHKWGLVYEKFPTHRIIKSNSFSEEDVSRFRTARNFITEMRKLWLVKCLTKDLKTTISRLAFEYSDWVKDYWAKRDVTIDSMMLFEPFFKELILKERASLDYNFYERLIASEFSKKGPEKTDCQIPKGF